MLLVLLLPSPVLWYYVAGRRRRRMKIGGHVGTHWWLVSSQGCQAEEKEVIY